MPDLFLFAAKNADKAAERAEQAANQDAWWAAVIIMVGLCFMVAMWSG